MAAIGSDGVDGGHKRGEEKTKKQRRDREHRAGPQLTPQCGNKLGSKTETMEKTKVDKSRKLSVKERGM